MLIDTHAHIHFQDYARYSQTKLGSKRLASDYSSEAMLKRAAAAGVGHIMCVGTTDEDSALAVEFAKTHHNCSATVGLHPHDAKKGQVALDKIQKIVESNKVVAVGECGLDYYYTYSLRSAQQKAFKFQIELAIAHQKPLIFHVREAFKDFFKIISEYPEAKGVVHSFTAGKEDMQQVLDRGFYIALNGITTFTKNPDQLQTAKQIPLERLLLETDCPFLTPHPKRGTINEPANVKIIAEFLARLRGESLEKLASATTDNAIELFNLKLNQDGTKL